MSSISFIASSFLSFSAFSLSFNSSIHFIILALVSLLSTLSSESTITFVILSIASHSISPSCRRTRIA
jgi:hypothetical protein